MRRNNTDCRRPGGCTLNLWLKEGDEPYGLLEMGQTAIWTVACKDYHARESAGDGSYAPVRHMLQHDDESS